MRFILGDDSRQVMLLQRKYMCLRYPARSPESGHAPVQSFDAASAIKLVAWSAKHTWHAPGRTPQARLERGSNDIRSSSLRLGPWPYECFFRQSKVPIFQGLHASG